MIQIHHIAMIGSVIAGIAWIIHPGIYTGGGDSVVGTVGCRNHFSLYVHLEFFVRNYFGVNNTDVSKDRLGGVLPKEYM